MKKRYPAEQIIGLLRRAEVELAQGRSVGEICRGLGVSEARYERWRSGYGGLQLDPVRRLKERERENTRRRKAVADLRWTSRSSKKLRRETSKPRASPGRGAACAVRARGLRASGVPRAGSGALHAAAGAKAPA